MTGTSLPVRLMSGLLWVLVASGPLLGGAALLRPVTTAPAAVAIPPGVEGMAELAVLGHLTALPGETTAWLEPALPALRLTASALEGLSGEEQAAAGRAAAVDIAAVAAVAATPAGPGRWGVTVGVLRAGRVEGWQVTVAVTGTGPRVETLPTLVGLPSEGDPPIPDVPALRTPAGDDPVAAAVTHFLSALLTGEGELSRYLAPGVQLPVPTVAGRSLQLRRLAVRPLGARHVAALAEARLIREDGAVHVLHYPLLLQPAGGRWEVVRLLPALPLDPGVEPSPADRP